MLFDKRRLLLTCAFALITSVHADTIQSLDAVFSLSLQPLSKSKGSNSTAKIPRDLIGRRLATAFRDSLAQHMHLCRSAVQILNIRMV